MGVWQEQLAPQQGRMGRAGQARPSQLLRAPPHSLKPQLLSVPSKVISECKQKFTGYLILGVHNINFLFQGRSAIVLSCIFLGKSFFIKVLDLSVKVLSHGLHIF